MSDLEQPSEEQATQQEPQAKNEESGKPALDPDIAAKLEELERLKSHQSRLMDETKSAKQRAQELEEAQRKAEEERLQKDQQFKELYEREQKAKQELAEKYNSFQEKIKAQEIGMATSSLVSQLTRDTSRAELLAEKAKQFAKHSDDGVIYEMGGVQVDATKVAEHLKERYPFLVDGSGATGGGATGTGRPGGAGDTNTAAQTAKQKGDLTGFLTAQLSK